MKKDEIMSSTNHATTIHAPPSVGSLLSTFGHLAESVIRFFEALAKSQMAAREYDRLINHSTARDEQRIDARETIARHVAEKYLAF